MAVAAADYQGNVNVGFFGVVTDRYAVTARGFQQDLFQAGAELRLGGTDLVGLFAAGNSSGLLVPDIVADRETAALDDADVPYTVLETRSTALGNLVLCNDHGAVVSADLADHRDAISDALDVPVDTGTVAGLDIPGSCGVATNQGVLLHRDASGDELAAVEDVLDVSGDVGSVNFGTPYVHSGVLAHSDAVLVGNDTTGPELQRVQDALGLL